MIQSLISSIALVGTAAASLPLIPLPVSVKTLEGEFAFSKATAIRFDSRLQGEAKLFAAELQSRSGGAPEILAETLKIKSPSEIRLDIDPSANLPVGGYKLEISPTAVSITGKDAAGVYYGTRSILQLLPPEGAPGWKDSSPEKLPAVSITDYPRFAWRGMMLDVSRHFYPPAEVKQLIDWMAFHKLNVFHWHLTDDQGWRIEIKSHPKLTEVGAWRDSSPPYGDRNSSDGQRHGGFYTQEQIREIVAYASARHITIVPEIEMPGHAVAAIAAYPQLGNSDIPNYAPEVMTHWGVQPYIFAPKDETFRFIEDVLSEVCELFPSKFIHIGGDEAPKTQWADSKYAQSVMLREGLKSEEELQSWFIRKIGTFLETKGRRLIGWDEIQEGGLPKSATMMVWRDSKWAKHALALGNDVVMATTSHTYFDYYQAPAESELAKGKEYEAIGGHLPLEKVYSYNPTFVAENAAQEKQILGTQAQLWSEYFKDMKKVQYMAFPRVAALAEVAWTPLALKNYDDFRSRLTGIMKHYDAGHLNYRRPDGQAQESSSVTPEKFHQLAIAELQRVAGPTLKKMAASLETRGFIRDLLASNERMSDLLLSGPLPNPEKSLRILSSIWKADPQGVMVRHEQTTAAAVALMFSRDKWPEDKAFNRYKFYRDSRIAGKLHPQFDSFDAWEKCFVVSGGSNGSWSDNGAAWGDDSLMWLRDHVKLTAKEYTDACWQAPYKLNNLFGDSIHGANYYAPFNHLIHAERVRDVGGVCGSLSHYGANAARANGLPATTMGEPGHCAYAVRVARGDWQPAYSLSWQRGLHISLWGNTWTQLVLQEKVLGDRDAYTKCMESVWQARALKNKDPEATRVAYAAAVEAQPLNQSAWAESLEFIRTLPHPDGGTWETLGKSISTAFASYPETAWDLLASIQEPAMKNLAVDRREEFFLNYHRMIASQDGPVMWDFSKALDQQAKALGGDSAHSVAFFEKVLRVQSSSKSWFAPTIEWGRKQFDGSASSTEFFAVLSKVFSSTSPANNQEGIKAALGQAIIAAEQAGNREAFQSLGSAAAAFRISKSQPETDGFSGTLLSSGGLLQVSSTCRYDSPVNHWGVLELDGGSFHTDRQVRPSAVVRLGKLGDVSGIVIAGNDYGQNGGRQMPLKVSVSEDGLAWQQVFRTTEPQGPWRIPSSDKTTRVLYVKVERDDERSEFFHLAGIRVYGQKLQ